MFHNNVTDADIFHSTSAETSGFYTETTVCVLKYTIADCHVSYTA